MSDFRFAGRWLNDRRVMSLTGDDFKAFVTAGTWMVENRTDGHITADDLDFVPRFNHASIPRLIIAGLWTEHGDGWLMLDYSDTQTSRSEFETLDNARRASREKKQRQRARKKDVPGDSPGDMSPGTTQDRTGQDRQGQEEVPSWPVTMPGQPEEWSNPDAPGSILASGTAA